MRLPNSQKTGSLKPIKDHYYIPSLSYKINNNCNYVNIKSINNLVITYKVFLIYGANSRSDKYFT